MNLTQPETKSDSFQQTDRAALSSPTFLKLADSILMGLDRRTAGELLAEYLYFKSKGRTEADFARFLLANKLDVILRIIGNSLPVLIPALLSDKELRTLVVNVVTESFENFGPKERENGKIVRA